MRSIRTTAVLLAALVLLTACSKQPPKTAQSTGSTTPAGAGETAAAPAALRKEAEALMAKRDWPSAIEKWKALTAAEPTSANWNDLSFAYLQAEQWHAAIDAGQKALKLDAKLPAAQYNLGMAYLGAGDACSAASYLSQSTKAQPDRYEPLLGLARAEMAAYEYAEAAYYAKQAAKVGAGQADFSTLLAALERMRQGNPPADLAKASAATLADGDVTLYLYPESQQKGCGGTAYTLYLVNKNGQTAQLPVGAIRPSGSGPLKLSPVTLPGGTRGYWLEVPDQSIYVSPASYWQLFAYQGGQLNQVLFTGETPWWDSMRSQGKPTVNGNQITQQYFNTANGATEIVIRSELQPDFAVAAVAEKMERAPGVITQLGSEIAIQVRSDNRGGGVPSDYLLKAPLQGDTQVLQAGKPVPLSVLQVGMVVRVTKSSQRTIVEVLSGGK